MRISSIGDKPTIMTKTVRSDEASATITAGAPVVLSVDGTEDGLAVVLPSTAGAAKTQAFLFGIALKDIAPSKLGEVQVGGMFLTAQIVRATRAASSDSWSSSAALSVGQLLAVDTVNNKLLAQASLGSNASAFLPWMAIAATAAAIVASATATSDTRTAITGTVKVFLRLL